MGSTSIDNAYVGPEVQFVLMLSFNKETPKMKKGKRVPLGYLG